MSGLMHNDTVWWTLAILGLLLVGRSWWTKDPRDPAPAGEHVGATMTSPLLADTPTVPLHVVEDAGRDAEARAELRRVKAFCAPEFAEIDKALDDMRVNIAFAEQRAARWHTRHFADCATCHPPGADGAATVTSWREQCPTGEYPVVTRGEFVALVGSLSML